MPIKGKSKGSREAQQLKRLREQQRAADKRFRERMAALKKERSAALKRYRHDVAVLKKRGIVSRKVDARKVKPTKAIKKVIRTFSDVIDKTARVFKIAGKTAKQYAKMGYRVHRRRVALPKEAGGYVPSRGRDRGIIKEARQVGAGPKVTRTVLPVDINNIDDFLQSQRGKPKLKDGESYGIRFFGWNLGQSFDNIDDLLDWFEHYHSIEDTRRSKDQTEVIANIEIVKIGSKQQLAWNRQYNQQRATARDAKRATYNKHRKYKPRKKSGFALAKKREYDRAYRKRTYDTFANTMKRRKQREKKK